MGDARIVLTTLIDEKLLIPGPKKLYVSYYRKRVYADLLADGSIRFKDQVYTSPVPCALHMKRTLNPSLKTDAGWSSMYSTASGESLKDIKDRLNIRKRGTNVRSTHKEKKAPTPSPTAKERVNQATATSAKYEVAPKCTTCRKEAMTDVVECSACNSKTHWTCASPALEAAPSVSWFCEKCLTGQANRILEFLQQTRRVLSERIRELKGKEEEAEEEKTPSSTEIIEKEDEDSRAEDDVKPSLNDKNTEDAAAAEASTRSVVSVESSIDGASVTANSSSEPTAEPTAASERKASEASAGGTVDVAREEASTEHKDAATDALEEKESKQEVMGVTVAKDHETFSPTNKRNVTADESINGEQLFVTKTTQASSAEEDFLVLIDGLIAEVSSKHDRADLITNTTGAMLVHLEKTQLVQLMESGKREILAATQPESEVSADEEQDDEVEDDQDGTESCNNSEVGALIKIFDLRHQILSSQSQFERTTSTLAKRTEMHQRSAEANIMELEESRTVETMAITKVVDLVNQYSSDLKNCKQKNYYNKVLLESINHRRSFIRSTNINDRFVPSYRYSTKLMTTSSDQLLFTVLLDKLRDITESVNEWTKMEDHFTKMTSSLNESLSLIGTKRKRTGAPVKLPPPSASFEKVRIPPFRRLIERQIANYQANLSSIRQERAQMRKTLFGILKIAREEHLSEEIVRMTDMLYQKCRDLKAEEEEEQLRLKEEAEAEAKVVEEEDTVCDRPSIDGGEASAEEAEAKMQRLDNANTASDSNSGSHAHSTAAIASNMTVSSEMKGISSLLGSEDSDTKDPNYSSAETKSRADNDEDSEEDLEQASRAIADITSSVLPDISGGSGSRVDLLNSSLVTEKLGVDASRIFASPGQFTIRGGRRSSDKWDAIVQQTAGQQQNQPATRLSSQNQQPFLDQALEVSNKQQQQQQRPEEQRLEQQCQLEQQQKELEERHQLERQRQLEQRQLEHQRLLEHEHLKRQHQERERQAWDRQERAHQERKHLEKQRQEQERREQQYREQQQLEQERYEEQLIEQQRIEEQRRLEEQHRLEQQRLEQQCLEKQQQLEQQHLEQLRHGKQRQQEQQHKEKQRLQQEQQRLKLEIQCRQQEQQRQEQECQFQHKSRSLPQVVPPGSSHLQMLSQQQQQQLQQQQAALQQQQHSRQLQHPLYGDMSKGMLMSSGMGTSQQDVYAQQAVQMGMDMHDIVRHQDSSHFVSNASGSLRGGPYMASNEVSRSAVQQQPAPTAPRTSFYGDEGHAGQLHPQTVFGSQTLSGQQRQLSDHHMFTNELQQQQPDQPRPIGNQDFIIGRPFRGLNDNMPHPGIDQSDGNDVDMGDWGQ